MKLIHHNPFRVAGILSNASERELQKQKTRTKAFTKVGKEIKSDYDFHILENLIRTEESINKAFSDIQQNQNKVNHALFWFINTSPYDNTALEYLKNGDAEKAVEIWDKVTHNKIINSKNFSAFNNLGTYKLLSKDSENIKDGIEAKIKLIESDYFETFIELVADKTYQIDKSNQSAQLIDEIVYELKNEFSTSEILSFFSKCNGSTRIYLSKKFTEEPIHNLESRIEKSKKHRKENKSNSYQIGLKLYSNSKEDLSLLKSLLDSSDLRLKTISDQLASEIMQCGIDYFKEFKDTKDPSKEGLKLLKIANGIAIGNQTKDRVNENINGIREWSETAPIKNDLAFITNSLKSFQNLNDTIINSKELVNTCKSKLQNIKGVLGSTDEFYLNISSAVVNNAMGMIISVVNEAQSGLEYNPTKLLTLPNIISQALSVIAIIESLDMHPETRQRFSENKLTIKGIDRQLVNIKRQTSTRSYSTTSSSTSSSNNSSWAEDNLGCLIFLIIGLIFIIASAS